MATPELVSGRLKSASGESAAIPLPSPDDRGQVIEFRTPGIAAHTPLPDPGDVSYRRSGGFAYDGVRAGSALRAGLSRRSAASRPLPMEDVCLHVKELDNTRLRRISDPQDARAWRRLVALGCLALIAILASHAPHALLRQSGYQLEKLHQQQQGLSEINEQLKVRHAMLSDLRRVTELAAEKGLTSTPPERFAWQDRTIPRGAESGDLAQNRGPN